MSNYDMTFDKKILDEKIYDTIFGGEEDNHLLDLVLKEDAETFGKDVRDPDAVEDGLGAIGKGDGLGNDIGPDHDAIKPTDDSSDQKILVNNDKDLKSNDQLNVSDTTGQKVEDGDTVNTNDVHAAGTDELVGNDPIPDERHLDDALGKVANSVDKFDEAMDLLLAEAECEGKDCEKGDPGDTEDKEVEEGCCGKKKDVVKEDKSDIERSVAEKLAKDRTSHNHGENNVASKAAQRSSEDSLYKNTGDHDPSLRGNHARFGASSGAEGKAMADRANKELTKHANSFKEADIDAPVDPAPVAAPPAAEEPAPAVPAPTPDVAPPMGAPEDAAAPDDDLALLDTEPVADEEPAAPPVEEPYTVDDLDADSAEYAEAAEPVNVDDVKDERDTSKIEDGLGKIGAGDGHGSDLGPGHDAIKPSADTSDEDVVASKDQQLKNDELNTADKAGATAKDASVITGKDDLSNVGEDHESADDSFKEASIEDLEKASEEDEDAIINAVEGNKEKSEFTAAELNADDDDEILAMLN